MGDATVVDAMTGALHDPFGHGHMGVTAENIAAKYGFTRQQQDDFALSSHRKAAKAMDAGYFKSQIVPIELKTRKGVEQYTTDEHVRPGATMDDLAKLKTVFKKDGTVTAGNASGINDAAAAIVLMEAGAAKKASAKRLARLVVPDEPVEPLMRRFVGDEVAQVRAAHAERDPGEPRGFHAVAARRLDDLVDGVRVDAET